MGIKTISSYSFKRLSNEAFRSPREGWDVDKGWNQLIVRSAKGQQLVDLAREKGVLEFREFGDEEAEAAAMNKLMRASASKREKALKL